MRVALLGALPAVVLLCLATASCPALTSAAVTGDANRGAILVAGNGCAGCHGAAFGGTSIAPKLVGIERRRTPAQIAGAIVNPTAPMPKIAFTAQQTADIAAYLASLDGGRGTAPVVTLTTQQPGMNVTLTVRFPTPPKAVTAEPSMRMGAGTMTAPRVALKPTAGAHVWSGLFRFSMGGPWTILVRYDGKTLTVPVNVSGAM